MLEATVVAIMFFPIGVLYASFAEWAIHKRLMHQPILGIQHFYFGHAKVHHGVYKADDTYVVGDRPPRELTLAWWAMPFPIMLQIPLLVAFALFISLPGMVGFVAALMFEPIAIVAPFALSAAIIEHFGDQPACHQHQTAK